jgi:hypothetical protein
MNTYYSNPAHQNRLLLARNQLAEHKRAFGVSVSDYLDWGFIGFLILPGEFWESIWQY